MSFQFRPIVFASALLVFLPLSSQAQWVQTSGPFGGSVYALAANGANLFAGSDDGVYLSTNGGTIWSAVNNGLTNRYVNAFGVNGTNLYAGTAGGVFLSTNDGTSWSAMNNGLTDLFVSAFAGSGTSLFAGTNGGVFLSTNGGTSWTAVNTGLSNLYVNAFAVFGMNLIAGTDGGPFLSTNNGTSWSAINSGLPSTRVHAFVFRGSYLFVGTSNGVFLSTNNGTNWNPVNSGLSSPSVLALATSDTNLFAGTSGGGVCLSTNNGTSWTAVNSGLTASSINAFAVRGANLFAGTSVGGVFLSTNNGTSWNAVNKGLAGTIVDAFAASGSNLFAGSYGGVFLSTNSGAIWNTVNDGLLSTDIMALAVSGTDVFAGTYGGGVFLSTNNGVGWNAVNNGLTATDVFAFAVSGTNIFAGTYSGGVYFSTNSGTSWSAVNNGLTSSKVNALAVRGTYVFAGTDDSGVFLSTNNGASWSAVNSGLTSMIVYTLAVNGTNLFAGTVGNGVFLSTNNGTSWNAVNTGLTTLDIWALTANGTNLFAATTGDGIWFTANNGTTWSPVNTGLTNLDVMALGVSGTDLYCGTYGAGVWRRPLSDFAGAPIPPTTLAPTGIGTDVATLNGTVNPNGVNTTAWFEWGTDAALATSSGTTHQALGAGSTVLNVTQSIGSLNPGKVYYYRIVAQTVGGESRGSILNFSTTLPPYPSTFTLSNVTWFPSRTGPGDCLTTDYRLFGLPGNSGASIATLFSGASEQDWRASWDNGSPNDYIVRYDATARFNLTSGKAFWVLSRGSLSVNTTVASAPLNANLEVEIPLHAGWNLIANPFTQQISWLAIQTANGTGESLYSYAGGFSEVYILKPFSGYYYYNTTNASVLRIPYRALFKPATEPPPDPALWRITIAATSGELSDSATSFGVAPASQLDIQTLCHHKPRMLDGDVSASFNRPDLDRLFPEFATDIRPEFERIQEWSFDFRGKAGQRALISFLGLHRIPASFEIWLIDHQNATTLDLRKDSVHAMTPATSLCKFTVLVGEHSAIADRLAEIRPTDFSLDQNFPNPFNPSTTLSVTVPRAAVVWLKIHDILGREVATIFTGTLEPGRHWYTWNGTDNAGRSAASGVYFAMFHVLNGPSSTQKMLKMQ